MTERLRRLARRWFGPHWYDFTEGDYLDLRPRLQIGRRRWL